VQSVCIVDCCCQRNTPAHLPSCLPLPIANATNQQPPLAPVEQSIHHHFNFALTLSRPRIRWGVQIAGSLSLELPSGSRAFPSPSFVTRQQERKKRRRSIPGICCSCQFLASSCPLLLGLGRVHLPAFLPQFVCLFCAFLYFSTLIRRRPVQETLLGSSLEDSRQPYARPVFVCTTAPRYPQQPPRPDSPRPNRPSLEPSHIPQLCPFCQPKPARQPNYIKTRRFADPLTWSSFACAHVLRTAQRRC
jgi:hypothetical protein